MNEELLFEKDMMLSEFSMPDILSMDDLLSLNSKSLNFTVIKWS